MKIILGLAIIAAGFFIIWKTEWLLSNFGRLEFFESKLATSGGSRLGYKLIGLLFVIIGLFIATGLIGGFLGWLTSPITKYNRAI